MPNEMNRPTDRWWQWVFTGLNLLALVLSVMLSWQSLSGNGMPGCSGESSCNDLLNSRWSKLAGILPVSALAVSVYLAMWVAGYFLRHGTEPSVRRLAWKTILVLAGVVAGSAVWFFILQKWIIGSFCLYCMITHASGMVLSSMILWRAFVEFDSQSVPSPVPAPDPVTASLSTELLPLRARRLPILLYAAAGLFVAGAFAAVQVASVPTAVYSDGSAQEELPVIDYQNVPMVGSPGAPYIVTLLFDYQCSHCQRLHFMLPEVVSRYNGRLAFALCPTPLSAQCNRFVPRDVEGFKNSCELARLGLMVWRTNREMFTEFEEWMFSYESGDRWQPRTLEATREKVIGWIGETAFQAAADDGWITLYMQQSIDLFGKTLRGGEGAIPRMIFGSRWVIPDPESADDLISILQESLLVPSVSDVDSAVVSAGVNASVRAEVSAER